MSRAEPTTATYLYCIVASPEPPDLATVPEGLPETSAPRLVELGASGSPIGPLWLVVGDAPLPAYSGEEIEGRLSDLGWVSARAVAHERVVAYCAAGGPVIPMKLFTLFESDARAVAELATRRERLAAVLERVSGHEEWGMRIHFDGARAKRALAATPKPAAGSSGRGFLERKKAEQEEARHLVLGAGEAVEETFGELSRHAAAARRREPYPPTLAESGPRLLLDAAFLVSTAAAAGFEGVVQGESERLAKLACEVTLTGPWPPYNFIEEVG